MVTKRARDSAGVTHRPPPADEREGTAGQLLAELHSLDEDDPRRRTLRDQLVELHMPLVVYLARRFSGRNEPMNDLVQVGSIGLIKAIDRFDPSAAWSSRRTRRRRSSARSSVTSATPAG